MPALLNVTDSIVELDLLSTSSMALSSRKDLFYDRAVPIRVPGSAFAFKHRVLLPHSPVPLHGFKHVKPSVLCFKWVEGSRVL